VYIWGGGGGGGGGGCSKKVKYKQYKGYIPMPNEPTSVRASLLCSHPSLIGNIIFQHVVRVIRYVVHIAFTKSEKRLSMLMVHY
jgi:hypothetical protein